MKRKQFSGEQIIGILKEAEAGAVVTELCRRHGLSSATYYAWKASSAVWRYLMRSGCGRSRRRTAGSSVCWRIRCSTTQV